MIKISTFRLIPVMIIDTPLIIMQISIAIFLPLIYENYGTRNPATEEPAKKRAPLIPSMFFLLQYRLKVLAIEFGLLNSSTCMKSGNLQAITSSHL